MPSQPRPGNAKTYPIQWVHIDDFSPGGYDQGHVSTEEPIVSAPLGAAYLPNTYCCASIPGGALAPLPAITEEPTFNAIGGIPGGSPFALITGFVITPFLNSGNYEVVTLFEADNGTTHYAEAWSLVPNTTAISQISGPTHTSPSFAGFFGSPYPVYTRMNIGGVPGPPPPGPVLVFPQALITDPNGTAGHLWVYPGLLAPTSYTAQDLVNPATQITGQTIAYGNRVICLAGVNYGWPAGGGINTNENFNYTDPPESSTYNNQQTIMAIESPWGYGAWGTVSVGELLVVKKYGGAVILNGDINVPSSIIRVPGVQSTGDFVGQAASTPMGLVYCSQNQGAWVWNGGNTAQKISHNLRDNFFDLQTNQITSNNYGFNVAHWHKWLLFSNNIIQDTETQGWWKLYPNRGTNPFGRTGRDIWWYVQGQSGKDMFCAPLKVFSSTDPGSWYSHFDNTVPSTFYNWQSLPIHVTKDADRVIDVRQVVVRASDPTNSGTALIIVSIGSFNSNNTGATPIGLNPTPIRFNVGDGARGVNDITLNIFALNSAGDSAPIIHSIDIGYIVRAGVAVAD